MINFHDLCHVQRLNPELRLCQLLIWAAHKGGWEQDDLFYCPDEVINKGLDAIINNSKAKKRS